MMTSNQAAALRDLIVEYRDAAIADAEKGGGMPEDWPEIEQNLKDAKENLEKLIHSLTAPPVIGD